MDKKDIEKRRAYRRKKAKKKRLIIGFVFSFLIALSIIVTLSLTVLFPVKKVVFSGNNLYSEEQLQENIGLKGKNIIVVSESKTLEEARKKLPYIKEIKISKKFPDTVSVEISEAEDYAAYRVGYAYYMISEDGYVLSQKKIKPENAVEIKAKESKQKIGEKVKYPDSASQDVIQTITEKLKTKDIKIDYIDVTSKTEITAGILNGRFKVVFGTKQNLDKKIDHLCEMIKNINKEDKGTITLTSWSESEPVARFGKE